MKKLILLLIVVLLAWNTKAQSRIEIANFSQFQQYFNPSLTGHNGAVLKTLYRNQWTGFEDAPKTILASAEVDLVRLGKTGDSFRVENRGKQEFSQTINLKHALGLTVLHDKFGPNTETQLFLSYGSGVRLTDELNLRWGSALTYHSNRFDGNSLTVDQQNDPRYKNVLGQRTGLSKVDLNLGLSLTSSNFFVGYALQGITEGRFIIAGDDFLEDMYVLRHIVQGGYRAALSDLLGFTVSGVYQHDDYHKDLVEGQLKLVYDNTLWVGTGYRNDLAYNIGAGFRFGQFSVSYAYEAPVQEAQAIQKASNEISLSYNLYSFKVPKQARQVVIW